ncbi:MAG: transglutaminase family protein [Thioalkalivibrio sp.]|nr:MAG: transglutaminase family protein [Thioalkalivibrio sp.]
MRYRVRHLTRYRYPAPVHGSLNELRLKPRPAPLQRLDHYRLEVQPSARYRAEHVDAFGNPATVLNIDQVHQEWSVSAVFEVTRHPVEAELAFEPWLSLSAARAHLRQDTSAAALDARGYTQASPLLSIQPALPQRLGLAPEPDQGIEAVARQVTRLIHREFAYRPGQTEVSTPLSRVIESRVGVCQDFAHLAVACSRALGIPARYVSGYLETRPPAGAERLVGADATHAWFAVYDPARGWLEFDPTNDAVPDQRYITLAWGRDYSDVAPVRGVVRGGGRGHGLQVSVDVQPIGEG